MDGMENMEYAQVKFPHMRMELISYIRGLSNKEYQYDEWVLHKGKGGVEDSFDLVAHFFYDDTTIHEDADEYIGLIFVSKNEADLVKNIVDRIDIIFEKYGLELSDKEYIDKPEWNSVIDAAQKALAFINNGEAA